MCVCVPVRACLCDCMNVCVSVCVFAYLLNVRVRVCLSSFFLIFYSLFCCSVKFCTFVNHFLPYEYIFSFPFSMTWSLPSNIQCFHAPDESSLETTNVETRVQYPQSTSPFIQLLQRWHALGVQMIGGCCRTRPQVRTQFLQFF